MTENLLGRRGTCYGIHMRILTTAFLALVLWIAWIVASVKFGVDNSLNAPSLGPALKNTAGQWAVLVGTFIPAALLSCASVFMLVRLPFKAHKKKRSIAALTNE